MVLTTPVIEFERPEDAVAWLRGRDFDVFLADADSGPVAARNYREYRYGERRTAFVLGAEKYGIPKAWYQAEYQAEYQSDFRRVFVPMLGRADSLNVSVSAAVLLYEARAQKENW
jgi:TrmH family RNA methyltransferase